MSKASPESQISVGGKSYTLKYSLKAYVALQDYFKVASIDEVMQRLNDPTKLNIMDIVAMLWAGFRSHHKDVTLDDAFDMADTMGLATLQDIISSGFGASVPGVAAGEAEESPNTRP